jgi:hypothetical protein
VNIFALHPDPAIAASMHCDQHLHKMILESAQMLSTVAGGYGFYTATHAKHPCTLWVGATKANAAWLVSLCEELDSIRMGLGSDSHKSMEFVRAAFQFIQNDEHTLTPFVFAGPPEIAYRTDLDVHKKYQALYRLKQRQWKGIR